MGVKTRSSADLQNAHNVYYGKSATVGEGAIPARVEGFHMIVSEQFDDERLVHFVQINAERLRSQTLGEVQRGFLKQSLKVALDDLATRGIEISGIYDELAS